MPCDFRSVKLYFLSCLALTEGRSTGFRKILDALKVNGLPLPEFETDEAHDYFVTRFFIREVFIFALRVQLICSETFQCAVDLPF